MSTLDLGKIKFLWKGTWSAASAYVANDVVAFNSSVWICTQSQTAGVGNEFAPGKRDRTSLQGKTFDPDELITFNITVQTVGSTNLFFIDGRQTPSFTLYPNVRYRFYQKDPSNLNHRFAFSSTADGVFGGGTEYTTGVTYTGTAGIDGYLDVTIPSNAPLNIYYFSAQDVGYGASTTGKLVRGSTWRGWQNWDLVTSGFTFKNTWNSVTNYYFNDIVEYQGATYLALADNLNKFPLSPGNNHFWLLMIPGDRRSEHNSVAHLMNKGPLDWPYANGHNGYPNAIGSFKFISRSGRVYHHGPGSNGSHGMQSGSNGLTIGQPQEICFNFFEWWNSRDNGGPGRMVTPDGLPPKCIQIEQGYTYAYFLFNNGEVWATGTNGNGEIGDGTFSTVQLARRVLGLQDVRIVKISVGYGDRSSNRHCLALDEYGYVWSWGYNDVGQLGHGHLQSLSRAERIPRAYFGGERVIDIVAMGHGTATSYARVASDNLYAWGYNGVYQLGDGTNTNRYRPVKMLNWDPVANAGIRKWQIAHYGTSAAFMILDGNGFLWGAGDDQFGSMGYAANSAARSQLTKSTQSPGGFITDFWALWSDSGWANKLTFIRHTNGSTYVCGLGSNNHYVNGLSANTSTIYPPTLIPVVSKLLNIKEVYLEGCYTVNQARGIHFLDDYGKVFAQGYNGYGEIGNPEKGTTSSTTDETGSTAYPIQTFLPPGTRIKQIIPGGFTNTDLGSIHGMFYMTDTGQIFANGMNRNTSGQRDSQSQSFMQFGQNPSEGAAVQMPVSLTYAR